MHYEEVISAEFIARPNRFIARVRLPEGDETVHVKNTGRCRELLIPGARVILARGSHPQRKTRYDLVAVYKGETLINMDSQAPNAAASELLPRLFPGAVIRPETKYGDSRFDFYLEQGEKKIFVEVKGVTLEADGHALFPDAPTQRGERHIHELIRARRAGYEAYILFLVQMKGCSDFSPNDVTHPTFRTALQEAERAGVGILCYDCVITEKSMTADAPVPVRL